MQISAYEFLHNQCGFNKVVSVGSMKTDLLNYYNQTLDISEIATMASLVENYLNDFWNTYNSSTKGENRSLGTKLINPTDGIYPYVIKVDFDRAFVNYSINVMSKPTYLEFKKNCFKIARMEIPSQAKKFLYNYVLTNLITRLDGIETLYKLRQMVYKDVMYLAYKYGEPLKSEIDGCYVKCTKDTFNNLNKYDDIFGSYKLLRIWRYVVLGNGSVTIAGLYGDRKYQIKGIPKATCNIVADTIARVALENNDRVLDDFVSDSKINIMDWCNKSADGMKVQILAKGSTVSLKAVNEEDIKNLYSVREVLDRTKYYNLIDRYITQFFGLWSTYGKKRAVMRNG